MNQEAWQELFGYKNHINADARHNLIRRYAVSDASVHDSQKLDDLLMTTNTSRDVFADSAYRSAETEAQFKRQGFNSRIHERAARGRPLSKRQHNANRKKSKVRARVEHVFGAQEAAPGGRLVRSIGIARAGAKIGLQNLVYNMRRLANPGTDGRRLTPVVRPKHPERSCGRRKTRRNGGKPASKPDLKPRRRRTRCQWCDCSRFP